MKHLILLTHGEFSKGIAQSCRFILGELPGMTALTITLDETIDQIQSMVESAMDGFGSDIPTILITDIPNGSTTQAGIAVMKKHRNVYLVTGLNLGLLLALALFEFWEDYQKNLDQIRQLVDQAKETMTVVNDMTADGFNLSEDGEL